MFNLFITGKLRSPTITYVSKATNNNVHINWIVTPPYKNLISEVLVSNYEMAFKVTHYDHKHFVGHGINCSLVLFHCSHIDRIYANNIYYLLTMIYHLLWSSQLL